MNNKGSITISLVMMVIAIILASAIAISFIFSSELRYVLIGVAVLGGGIYMLSQTFNSKTEISHNRMLIAFAILSLGVFFILSSGTLQTTFGGAEVYSISKVDVIDVGERILISASVGNGAEEFVFDFTPQQLNQYLADSGYAVDKGVSGSIQLTKWQHSYPFVKQPSQIFYKLYQENIGNIYSVSSCTLDKCKTSGVSNAVASYIHEAGWWETDDCVCVKAVEQSRNAVYSGLERTKFEIQFNVGGESAVMTQDNQVISIRNGQFEAQFTGTISALDDLQGINYDAEYSDSNFQHLIRKGAYNSERDSFNRIGVWLDDCAWITERTEGNIAEVEAKYTECVNEYKVQVDTALIPKDSELEALAIVESVDFITQDSGSGELVVDMASPDSFPMIKIWVDASYVGLKRLSGIPEITSCVPEANIKSGDSIESSFSARNIGSSAGMFIFSGTCSSPNVKVNGNNIYLNPGEEVYSKVNIIGSTTEDLASTCTITLTDENGGLTDSCTFGVNVEYSEIICSPLSVRCDDNSGDLLKCSASGEDEPVFKDCSSPCKWDSDSSEYRCGEDIGKIITELEVCVADVDCSAEKSCVNGTCIVTPLSCKWYQDYYSKDKKYWGLIPAEQGCRTSPTLMAGLLITLTLIGYIVSILLSRKKHRKKR